MLFFCFGAIFAQEELSDPQELIDLLDDNDFKTRESATHLLVDQGLDIFSDITEALALGISLEAEIRLRGILKTILHNI